MTVSTTNSHQVVTGAYDGIVRVLWDLRIGGAGGLEVWKVGEETAWSLRCLSFFYSIRIKILHTAIV